MDQLQLLNSLQTKYPAFCFTAGNTFSWSPKAQQVVYSPVSDSPTTSSWSLLHETAHALLEHRAYSSDFELIRLEMAAWKKARELGEEYNITINEEYIQDCLDTYRDWLYKRSVCPTCSTKALQVASTGNYRCHNCHATWRVSTSRFCRTYRATAKR